MKSNLINLPISQFDPSQRIQFSWWLAGFIEGEGSLNFSVKRNFQSKWGFQFQPEFSLTQLARGEAILTRVKEFFECGNLHFKSGSLDVMVYDLHSVHSLLNIIVPFYRDFVLPFSCKHETFAFFVEGLQILKNKEHLRLDGVLRLIDLVYQIYDRSKGRGSSRRLTKSELISLVTNWESTKHR
jgi:LAGLIDADG endonuclease